MVINRHRVPNCKVERRSLSINVTNQPQFYSLLNEDVGSNKTRARTNTRSTAIWPHLSFILHSDSEVHKDSKVKELLICSPPFFSLKVFQLVRCQDLCQIVEVQSRSTSFSYSFTNCFSKHLHQVFNILRKGRTWPEKMIWWWFPFTQQNEADRFCLSRKTSRVKVYILH